MSIGSSLVLTLVRSNHMDHTKAPTYTFAEIQKANPVFKFAIHYETIAGRKRVLVPRKKVLIARPRFVGPKA